MIAILLLGLISAGVVLVILLTIQAQDALAILHELRRDEEGGS